MESGTDALSQPANKISTPRLTCRACAHKGLHSVVDLGTQYLPRFPYEIDPSLPRAPLELVYCKACGLLQLGDTVEPDLLFRHIWYKSSINQTMRVAMSDLVLEGLKHHEHGTWLDIGANDGNLLSQVPKEFTKIAVDPALNFKNDLDKHADLVINDYFKAEDIPQACEVITTAAMFYDLDEPGPFIKDIVKLMGPGSVWINQLNDSPTMLKRNAFDSICHEHVCYYDIKTLSTLYARHGLKIVSVSYNEVNGGSVRVVAKRDVDVDGKGLTGTGVNPEEVENFARRVRFWRERMVDLIRGVIRYRGPLWGYGASTKGTVLLQYLDCSDVMIGVAERNPEKVGRRMVGSWVPIVDEKTMREAKPAHVLILPWSDDFTREFMAREKVLRHEGTTFIRPLPDIELIL